MACNKRLTVYLNNSEKCLLSLYGKLLKTCKNYPLIFARILRLFLKEYYSNLIRCPHDSNHFYSEPNSLAKLTVSAYTD